METFWLPLSFLRSNRNHDESVNEQMKSHLHFHYFLLIRTERVLKLQLILFVITVYRKYFFETFQPCSERTETADKISPNSDATLMYFTLYKTNFISIRTAMLPYYLDWLMRFEVFMGIKWSAALILMNDLLCRLRILVNTVMHIRLPHNTGNSVTSWMTISFSRWTPTAESYSLT
jgi:hypothetical protein